MTDTVPPLAGEAVLEVVSPDGARRYVRITQTPFMIGRGAETGNHLQLSDRRISRNCAAVVIEANRFYVEDRGQRRGLFVNGEKVESRELQDGDAITFGLEDSYEILFRSATSSNDNSLPQLLTRMEHITSSEPTGGGLFKLKRLLEATSLLHSQLPLDVVLGHMLDHAVSVTDADRGLLLESDAAGTLKVKLARRSGGLRLPPESLSPSQTAIQLALKQQSPVITEDLAQADMDLQAAQSIVAQRLRAVVVIPLYAMSRAKTDESMINVKRGDFLGVLYLDSRRPAAFSKLDRQILDALAADAASILDNARLVEKERERQRFEQEINIARDIQQALLPRDFREFPHLAVTGFNLPCLSVGGDYFDVFPLGDGRTAFLIADVSGKGLGAALLTTMLQGALSGMTLGTDPARVFNHVNRFLCGHSEVGRYATMFFGILDQDGHLEYINAGHPSPFLIRNGAAEEAFTEGSYPVGLVPEAEYTSVGLKLEPGDTLVLFSDGVTEAMDPDDQLFGVPRLKQVLNGQTQCPLEHIQKCVLEAVENFTRGAHQADDVTLLIVRYRATAAAVTSDTDAPLSAASSSSASAAASSARYPSATSPAAASD
jgi:serine phosphatase RsbU (regulator of sigma subunit)